VAAEAAAYRPAFGHLALLVQVPGVEIVAQAEAEKGALLTPRERVALEERIAAVRRWLEAYAPDAAVIRVAPALPPEAADLSVDQRRFLHSLAMAARSEPPMNGETWQSMLFGQAGHSGVPTKLAFEAVYRAFLGRQNGPRAGWLLASLDPGFVEGRLFEAAGEVGARADRDRLESVSKES
jgi:lysyl-tRNA synthetase class 1